MNTQTIRLDRLQAHPANSNVMPEHLLAKLADHIADTGLYPPLIVRNISNPKDDGAEAPTADASYQILDGHHRVEALKRLGHESAQCIVWLADDQEALLLLATLNRLQGQDDPRKRAKLIASLVDRRDTKSLAKLLPECAEQVNKLLEINTRLPQLRAPQPTDSMPVAVHFFLLPQQKRRLNERLRAIGGSREDALMMLVEPRA